MGSSSFFAILFSFFIIFQLSYSIPFIVLHGNFSFFFGMVFFLVEIDDVEDSEFRDGLLIS